MKPFHALYVPGDPDLGTSDKFLGLFKANTVSDIRLRLSTYPEAIALELDATDSVEAQQELVDLGFSKTEANMGWGV